MVLALAGDSTITNFAMLQLLLFVTPLACGAKLGVAGKGDFAEKAPQRAAARLRPGPGTAMPASSSSV